MTYIQDYEKKSSNVSAQGQTYVELRPLGKSLDLYSKLNNSKKWVLVYSNGISYREMHIKQINLTFIFVYTSRHTLSTCTDQGIYTQLVFHPSHPVITLLLDLAPKITDDMDNICYNPHTVRVQYLIPQL